MRLTAFLPAKRPRDPLYYTLAGWFYRDMFTHLPVGPFCFEKTKRGRRIEVSRRRRGHWSSADRAARDIAGCTSGVRQIDQHNLDVSADLIDWRRLGESL